MADKKRVNVTVCSDPMTLGPTACLGDVIGYAASMCELLESEFGCKTILHFGSGERTVCDDALISERIREIESTDEWRKLLP